jgi:hypothetical protein
MTAPGAAVPVLCAHHACRCAAAERMARIYDPTGRASDLVRAIRMHGQRVPCQLTSRFQGELPR